MLMHGSWLLNLLRLLIYQKTGEDEARPPLFQKGFAAALPVELHAIILSRVRISALILNNDHQPIFCTIQYTGEISTRYWMLRETPVPVKSRKPIAN